MPHQNIIYTNKYKLALKIFKTKLLNQKKKYIYKYAPAMNLNALIVIN